VGGRCSFKKGLKLYLVLHNNRQQQEQANYYQ